MVSQYSQLSDMVNIIIDMIKEVYMSRKSPFVAIFAFCSGDKINRHIWKITCIIS